MMKLFSVLLLFKLEDVASFLPIQAFPATKSVDYQQQQQEHQYHQTHLARLQPLYSGIGVATNYTWYEEAFEVEVSVKVPKGTKGKDVVFKATSKSLDLRINHPDTEEEIQLLDPSRELCGRILTDGTYWEISDPDELKDGEDEHRIVTVTFEKSIRTPRDDFDVIKYDWNGIYKKEFEDEVSERKYDEPEKLDVREYAAGLGVDIDNINMSMVDKTMFNSGLNMTQKSVDALADAGYVKEVTKQADGSEWVTDEDGEKVPFSSLGKDAAAGSPGKIPFVDTDSPWHKAKPIDAINEDDEDVATAAPPPKKSEKAVTDAKKLEQLKKQRRDAAVDPIDTLTVAKLKDILRSKGLKVSGNKKELQERLRGHVQSLLKESKADASVIDIEQS